MFLPMTKKEAAKIDIEFDVPIPPATATAIKKHFERLTDKEGDECIKLIVMPNGRLHLDLGTIFGFDEASKSTPSIEFSIVDLVRDHLEGEVWFAQAGRRRQLVNVAPFRQQLHRCLQMIDEVAQAVKEKRHLVDGG